MRVAHIISGLGQGGAETLLYNLCTLWAHDKDSEHVIISLTDNNCFDFEALNIKCHICPIESRLGLPWQLLRLRRTINTIQPDLIHASMYHASLCTQLTARPAIPQIWGVHHALHHWHGEPQGIRFLVKLLALLQKCTNPAKIIFASSASMQHHCARGYAAEKSLVIYNGVDCEKFTPSQKNRENKRTEFGIQSDEFLIGNFGRFHEVKNHQLLANILAKILKKNPKVKLALAGTAMTAQNPPLAKIFSNPIFRDKILFLGSREDIAAIFSALDCYVLTSHSESFSMVLLEAAACGVPIIANNVGDTGKLILDKQFLVNHNNEQDFVNGIEQIMSLSGEELGKYSNKLRAVVQNNFSIKMTAEKYMDIFRQVLENRDLS